MPRSFFFKSKCSFLCWKQIRNVLFFCLMCSGKADYYYSIYLCLCFAENVYISKLVVVGFMLFSFVKNEDKYIEGDNMFWCFFTGRQKMIYCVVAECSYNNITGSWTLWTTHSFYEGAGLNHVNVQYSNVTLHWHETGRSPVSLLQSVWWNYMSILLFFCVCVWACVAIFVRTNLSFKPS